jgi:hypothetical protein
LRQKEDPLNSIMSGAAAGAVMAARNGPKQVALSNPYPNRGQYYDIRKIL